MKVITSNPITIDNGRISNEDRYLNAPGDLFESRSKKETFATQPLNFGTPTGTIVAGAPVVPKGATPTVSDSVEASKKGLVWDKVKGGWAKTGQFAKDTGLLDLGMEKLRNVIGLGAKEPASNQTFVNQSAPENKG